MIMITLGTFLFALSHSILASSTVKQAMRRSFGERAYHGLYRLFYNIVATISLSIIVIYIWLEGTVIWQAPDTLKPILLFLQTIGFIGVIISLLHIRAGEFLGITQLRHYMQGKPLPLPPEPLRATGLYRLVRHPLYLFALLIIWPIITITDLYLVFAIITTAYFLIGSRFEEKRMIELYGDAYRQYQKRVPWMLPYPRVAIR